MSTRIAAYVSVVEVSGMPSSSRKPMTSSPPCQPAAYCPRAVCRDSSRGSRTAESALIFSARREGASNDTGSSIATSASSWSRWFWMTSRAAPMPS
ncbi:Uncharacterised protein [Mycobacteroides abscessus]|nr:Uncharacterised protein [Mycobacteroides abscessus]